MAKTSDATPETLPLRAYLLGSASEREVDAVESACFAGEDAVDRVAEAEDDLIADYLDGRLDPDEQDRFERHYLAAPRHRERVALVRALREKASASAARRGWRVLGGPRTLVLTAFAAALLAWLAIGRWLRGPVGPVPVEQVAQLLVPSAGLRSGGAMPTLELDATTTRVELRLERGETPLAPPLLATIRTVDGEVAWRGAAAPPQGEEAASLAAIVTLAADSLPSGDLLLSLAPATTDEAGSVERYAFRVRRR